MAVQKKNVSKNKKRTVATLGNQNSFNTITKENQIAAQQNSEKIKLYDYSINVQAAANNVDDVPSETLDIGAYRSITAGHDDSGASSNIASPASQPAWKSETKKSSGTNAQGKKITNYTTEYSVTNKDAKTDIYHSGNLFSRSEVRNSLYTKTFRFGLMNPYGAISTSREYLFFTKPDLNIFDTDENLMANTTLLQEGLRNIFFWTDLRDHRYNTIKMLQNSLHKDDPFNHLLQNQIISNLDVPALSAEMTETPTNMYGVNFSYRGSSESSDDNPEFSLEFKDTRYLDTYYFFKAYEEYETLKHHGVIRPSKYYIKNKELHDAFSIYKFIVDEDMETILYYGKMYGVMPKSLPRDVFSNPTFDNGLSYSIDFKAAFYEDMKPDILSDFNTLSKTQYMKQKYQLRPYNMQLDHADMRPGGAAFVYMDKTSPAAKKSPTGYLYKLIWRGSDKL